jgi:hypothetical protein
MLNKISRLKTIKTKTNKNPLISCNRTMKLETSLKWGKYEE